MKKVLSAAVWVVAIVLAALAQLFLLGGVQAQTAKTKTALTSEVNLNFADNASQAITAALLRATSLDMINSWQQYAVVNAQAGVSYLVVVDDYGKLITLNNAGSVAVSLPQATGSFAIWNVYFKNLGVGTVTITPTTSTINGVATLVLTTGQSAWVVSDGVNYQVVSSASGVIGIGQLPADSTTWRTATVNDTILTTDCWKTLQLGTGSTGYISETFPSVAGFPTGCEVTIKNGDTGRAKLWVNAPSDIVSPRLWPLQVGRFKIVNGAWTTTLNPGWWALPAAQTIHVDTVNGTDSTAVDGFTSGAGAFKSDTYAYSQVQSYWDCNVQFPCATETLDQTTNTIAATQTFDGPLRGTRRIATNFFGQVSYVINGAGIGSCTVAAGANGVVLYNITGNATLQFQNCNAGAGAFTSTGGFNVDSGFVVFTAAQCVNFGFYCLHATSSTGRITATGTWGFVGSENTLANAEDGGLITLSGTLNCTGATGATTAILQADIGSVIDTTGLVTSGCGAVNSKRVQAIANGTVFCNGANIALGTGGITISSGGYSDCGGGSYLPAPSLGACGTSPSLGTNTNDFGGLINVGSGVVSSCTLNWGLVHGQAPACTISSGTAIASATMTTSTTQMVIGGTSLTSDAIRFVCANLP